MIEAGGLLRITSDIDNESQQTWCHSNARLEKLQKTRRVVKPIENPLGIAETTTNFFWRLK